MTDTGPEHKTRRMLDSSRRLRTMLDEQVAEVAADEKLDAATRADQLARLERMADYAAGLEQHSASIGLLLTPLCPDESDRTRLS